MCPGKPGSAVMADDAKNQWCFGKESVEAAIAAVGRGELVSCHPPLVDSARSSCSFRSLCCNFLAFAQQRHSMGLAHMADVMRHIFARISMRHFCMFHDASCASPASSLAGGGGG